MTDKFLPELKRLMDEIPSVGDHYVKRYLFENAPAIAELVEVTKEYYDAQQEWAKYRLALDNAEANYSDSAPDEKLFMAAVLRVNKAEHALSEALAKLNGGKHEG